MGNINFLVPCDIIILLPFWVLGKQFVNNNNQISLIEPRVGIVLEYCERGSLEYVLQHFKLTPEQQYHILYDIVKGMQFLHSKNIIHRDLKCANVLIDKGWTAKITDFDVAKQKSDNHTVCAAMF